MDMEEISNKLEFFNEVVVTGYNNSLNASGAISRTVTILSIDSNNFPQKLANMAVSITTTNTPIDIVGRYEVCEHECNEIRMTFNCDRKFIFILNQAYEKAVYDLHNKEVDEDIEKWLGDPNDSTI